MPRPNLSLYKIPTAKQTVLNMYTEQNIKYNPMAIRQYRK